MPLCDSQTLTVLLVLLLVYALSPIDVVAEKTHGRRHVDDVFLLVLLAIGVAILLDNCPGR